MSTTLIADDSDITRETLPSILDGQGYILVTAEDGPNVLKQADANKPDLILLDDPASLIQGIEAGSGGKLPYHEPRNG